LELLNVRKCMIFPIILSCANRTVIFTDNPFGDLKSYAAEDNRIVNSGSLIAVSYEARARGVKRNMRGAEAKKVMHQR